MLAFWGTAIFISILLLIFTDLKLLFALLTFTLATIPIALSVMSYQAHIQNAKAAFNNLSQNSKRFHMTFYEDADGFDCVNGKDFSHISWETIGNVREKERCFVFEKSGSFFIIPKTAFRSQPEIEFFEILIKANVNGKIRQIK